MSAVDEKPDKEVLLKQFCAEHENDPLGFVQKVYPWGKPGSVLENWAGPDDWQAEVLTHLGEKSLEEKPVWLARASGHGIGKTALIAWIIHWFASTRDHPQIVVTANTRIQLESKTWRELAKWQKLAKNGDQFEHTATRYASKDDPKTCFATAIPWSKERSEAFAGTHEKHVLILFDEGSIIPDVIYEVAEGSMTTPGAMFIVFGNPTRNSGRFYEIFHGQRHLWNTAQIDSRATKVATGNKALFDRWIQAYGEDSDFFRVRAKGQFPRAGSTQFISSELVEQAVGRSYLPSVYQHAPRILGVDVARFGDDQSVIIRRQGLAASNLRKFRGIDTMRLASAVAEEIKQWDPDAVFVDAVGVGAGVVDRLHQLKYRHVIGVNAGSKAVDHNKYFNLRAEMWGQVKDWLEAGGMIPDDQELRDDLIGPEYGYDPRERTQLEKKVDMKERGLASPDSGDALALTFAQPVMRRADRSGFLRKKNKYNPRGHLTNAGNRFGRR